MRLLLAAAGLLISQIAHADPIADASSPAAPVGLIDGSAYDHNGSTVMVHPENGLIIYQSPKPSMEDVAPEGTVLFRGPVFSYSGAISGTAYAFKKGCAPAPYAVSGGYSADNATITLRGASPAWKGCDVVGYRKDSPNAVLRFKSMMSP
ncbi:hypothetical protein GCM10007301_45750 [Azorhizobium oxalatiphilum]|uniref:Uncharacterized protein n=1 Tax=Azorhizobium oxalatiphilum TaxID=980631 RepID=A0A917FIF4_9HYPH|nr:hypothetical protein [Azorhizobium oxalatiphilum]GGF80488.1 hypothetical protein GCM10007301_45750 [Azorhizobium oxalatiphilum]